MKAVITFTKAKIILISINEIMFSVSRVFALFWFEQISVLYRFTLHIFKTILMTISRK